MHVLLVSSTAGEVTYPPPAALRIRLWPFDSGLPMSRKNQDFFGGPLF